MVSKALFYVLLIIVALSCFSCRTLQQKEQKEKDMSYYLVTIYSEPPQLEHRTIFSQVIDENPVQYFVNFKNNFTTDHPVKFELLNWKELTEDEYKLLKEVE